MRRLTITMRTANRLPAGRNYLWRTMQSLMAGGVRADDVHVFPTDPNCIWLADELPRLNTWLPMCHLPKVLRTPNENGIAQVQALDWAPAEWLLMLEDDIEVCADFQGSVLRWLDRHEDPDVHIYRFCGFGSTVARRRDVAVYPLREQRGSQAIAVRAEDAKALPKWVAAKGPNWRPRGAPFQDQPDRGFDKLIGYWALDRWPASRVSYVSEPHFVKHIGVESGLYTRTVVNDAQFRRQAWEGAA